MKPDRAWVLLPSGRTRDLLQPDADAWTDRDLAISLSRTYRWGGHSRWTLPLSVAQHSLLVLAMRQKMNSLQPLTRAEALRELLHDAEEGFLCFDPISPLKPHLGEDFKTVSNRLRAAIATSYGVEPWDCADYVQHKQADHLAAASEAFHVTGWSREEHTGHLHLHLTPTSASWIDAVEGFFAKLTNRRLKRGLFHSIIALQAAINRLVKEANQDPKPFRWTKHPDEIMAAGRREHQTLYSHHQHAQKR